MFGCHPISSGHAARSLVFEASVSCRFKLEDDVAIVGFFASDDSTAFEAFSDAAEMLREVRAASHMSRAQG